MLQTLTDFRAWYKAVWDSALNSGTIFMARLFGLIGVIISAVSIADWSPLLTLFGVDTGFSSKQGIFTGLVIMGKALADEITRRRGTLTTESSRLVPATITIPEIKAAKKNKKAAE